MSLINRDDGRLCFKPCPDNEPCVCRDRTPKLTKAYIDEAVEYVFKNNPPVKPAERKMIMWTGCSTYGMIEANKYCDDLECTNCTRRAQEFCDALDKIVKNGYPNISDNGQ